MIVYETVNEKMQGVECVRKRMSVYEQAGGEQGRQVTICARMYACLRGCIYDYVVHVREWACVSTCVYVCLCVCVLCTCVCVCVCVCVH
jgi:hypothetical protein